MKGKSADLEIRETAFQTYRECGGNIEKTVRELEKKGYKISKPTIYDWIEKFDFKERMTRADLKAQAANDAVKTTEAQLLADLMKQKEKYERYFDSIGKSIDNQAQYAYTSLIKTIVEIKTKLWADKAELFGEFMRELIKYLSKEDPSAVEAIERNLDKFVAFAQKKYGA